MKKHFFLHTSDLENIKYIKEDIKFKLTFQYPEWELAKTHRNEYGRIETQQNYYHFLIGQMKQENCPWCGCGCNIEKVSESSIVSHARYCMICLYCGARGPVLNIAPTVENDPVAVEQYKMLIKQRFETRRPWDANLENVYE